MLVIASICEWVLLGQVYKAGALTAEKLKGAEVSWRDVFDEIPISISNRWAVSPVVFCKCPSRVVSMQCNSCCKKCGAGLCHCRQ